jgi:outer membrane lipase/esterase
MRSLRASLAATAVASALFAGSAGAQFSNAFVFGDSLSDAGQYGARFTTNPGLTTAMYVAARYGIVVTPSFTGGTDFAQGGARVNSPSLASPPNFPYFSVVDQVSTLLSRGPLDSNALYYLQGGANDILQLAALAAAGSISPADVQSGTIQAALDLAAQAARLQAAGARYLVVSNAPDIGRTPLAAPQNAQATFTALSNLFNSTLGPALASANVQFVPVNTFLLMNEVIPNAAAYGFVNVTTPVCTTANVIECNPSTLRDPNGALTWFFADGFHPTTGTALLAAAATESMIEGPARIGALAEAPLAVSQATFRSIDARMISAVNAPGPANRFNVWVNYDYGRNDVDSRFLSGDADVNTVAVGGDYKVTDRFLIGGAFSYSDNKGDFGDGNGGYKLKETTGTIYAGYGTGPWYVGATLGAGDLDYSDVHRNIQLGALTRTESGETRGWHVMGSILGGYWFAINNDWLHGPFARLSWEEIHVKGFAERGSDSTALIYGEQERKSFITSLGWQLSGRVASVRPFARVTWEAENKDDDRFVSASSVTLGGGYSVPTLKPDNSFVRYVLGASADFAKVTGYVVGEATSGRSTGNEYGVTVGIRVPL